MSERSQRLLDQLELAPFQYSMLAIAIGTSLWIIVRGVVIDPPARLLQAINKSNARMLRLLRGSATARA